MAFRGISVVGDCPPMSCGRAGMLVRACCPGSPCFRKTEAPRERSASSIQQTDDNRIRSAPMPPSHVRQSISSLVLGRSRSWTLGRGCPSAASDCRSSRSIIVSIVGSSPPIPASRPRIHRLPFICATTSSVSSAVAPFSASRGRNRRRWIKGSHMPSCSQWRPPFTASRPRGRHMTLGSAETNTFICSRSPCLRFAFAECHCASRGFWPVQALGS